MWWCWLALSAGAMEMQWVQEVEVGLRVAPSERSTVLSRARIGTAVEVVEAAGTWRRIRLLGRPLDYPVEGWVVGDTLGGRLRAADLWAESEVATDPEVAVGAAERALALDGSDPIAWEFLGSLREAVEDRGGAEWARRRGGPPVRGTNVKTAGKMARRAGKAESPCS